MSALWEYVRQIERQADLLECAQTYDSIYCAETPESAHVTRAPGIERRRHWTRQDRNRFLYEVEFEEAQMRGAAVDEILDLATQRRMGTRLGWFLRKFDRPKHSLRQAFHPAALNEARQLGIYNVVAPLLVEATNAHMNFLKAHDEPDLWDWNEVTKRRDGAIASLKMHLPARSIDLGALKSLLIDQLFSSCWAIAKSLAQETHDGPEAFGRIRSHWYTLTKALNEAGAIRRALPAALSEPIEAIGRIVNEAAVGPAYEDVCRMLRESKLEELSRDGHRAYCKETQAPTIGWVNELPNQNCSDMSRTKSIEKGIEDIEKQIRVIDESIGDLGYGAGGIDLEIDGITEILQCDIMEDWQRIAGTTFPGFSRETLLKVAARSGISHSDAKAMHWGKIYMTALKVIRNEKRRPLIRRIRTLAERFRRITTTTGDGNREVIAACAWGGNLATKASQIDVLPIKLPKPLGELSEQADDFTTTWVALVGWLAEAWPSHFPADPSQFGRNDTANKERAVNSVLGWRVRAENYGEVCDTLADWWSSDLDVGPAKVETDPHGIVRIQSSGHKVYVVKYPDRDSAFVARSVSPLTQCSLPLPIEIPGGDSILTITLRRQADDVLETAPGNPASSADSAASEVDIGHVRTDPPTRVPLVYIDPQRAWITHKGTKHPVPHSVAEAFQRMIDAKGQPIGIGDILREKPSRAIRKLPQELRAIVSQVGNKGYRVTVFD
jgi:hypothetical protein